MIDTKSKKDTTLNCLLTKEKYVAISIFSDMNNVFVCLINYEVSLHTMYLPKL